MTSAVVFRRLAMLAIVSPLRIAYHPKPLGASNGTGIQLNAVPVPVLVPAPEVEPDWEAPPVAGMLVTAVPGTMKVWPPWKVRLRFLVTNDCSWEMF